MLQIPVGRKYSSPGVHGAQCTGDVIALEIRVNKQSATQPSGPAGRHGVVNSNA